MEFHPLRILLGVMLAFAFPGVGVAQLTLNVTTPAASVTVGTTIPYTITVSGQGQVFSGVQVTSTYSPSLDFVSASPQDGNVTFSRQDNTARFVIQQLVPGSNAYPYALFARCSRERTQ